MRLPAQHSPGAWHKIQSKEETEEKEKTTFPFTQSVSIHPLASLPHHQHLMYDPERDKIISEKVEKANCFEFLISIVTPTLLSFTTILYFCLAYSNHSNLTHFFTLSIIFRFFPCSIESHDNTANNAIQHFKMKLHEQINQFTGNFSESKFIIFDLIASTCLITNT